MDGWVGGWERGEHFALTQHVVWPMIGACEKRIHAIHLQFYSPGSSFRPSEIVPHCLVAHNAELQNLPMQAKQLRCNLHTTSCTHCSAGCKACQCKPNTPRAATHTREAAHNALLKCNTNGCKPSNKGATYTQRAAQTTLSTGKAVNAS